MLKKIEYLDWDSNFFNLKVGQIIINKNDDLEIELHNSLNSKYELLYIISDKNLIIDNKILIKYCGKLVDRKVTFIKEILSNNKQSSFIYEYLNKELNLELEQLAYEAGKYSRFKLDDNIENIYFYKMYKIWIEESIKHNIASNVFIANENNTIKGFATLKLFETKGVIGLIAVSPDSQGKGYGRELLNSCENELYKKNIKYIEVSTQYINENACNFYKKCNYKISEIKNVYHFWIKNYDSI